MKVVVFPKYISDGPGYAGPVEVTFDQGSVGLRLAGSEPVAARKIDGVDLPVVGWRPATEADVGDLWDFLDEDIKSQLESREFLPTDRIAWLDLEGCGLGAVMLGGEPQFLTLIDIRKGARSGGCVSVEL